MFHLLAFTKASAGGVTLEDVPGVQDNVFALNGANHYLPPVNGYIALAYMLSPNATKGQISVPHFRQVALPAVEPLDIGTAATSLPAFPKPMQPYISVPQNDEIATLQSDNAGAGIQKYSFLWFYDTLNRNCPQGDRYTLFATASNTGGNKVWGSSTMTFDQTIPVGTYSVQGMDVVGANLIAARLIFPGQVWRPGCLARVSEATKPDPIFRNCGMGEYGQFTNTAPPSLEVFGNAAGTTQIVALDVVKVK